MSYWAIGQVYTSLAEYEAAEPWLNKALQIQSDDLWAFGALIWNYRRQGRWAEATPLNEQMVLMAPESPRSWNSAGFTALYSGNHGNARHYFERAIQLAPVGIGRRGIPFSTHLGYLHWKAGEREEARRYFNQSLRFDKAELAAGRESYHPFLDLSYVHSILGDKERALQWYEKAVEAGWLAYDWERRSPLLHSLRDEPRFQQMLAQIESKVKEMRLRVREMENEWGWDYR
jgi:tetratricopeptide (TPR) repeat protein